MCLLPADKWTEFTPPAATIPNSVGHYKEWLDAIRNGGTHELQLRVLGRTLGDRAAGLRGLSCRRGIPMGWPQADGVERASAEHDLRATRATGWELKL